MSTSSFPGPRRVTNGLQWWAGDSPPRPADRVSDSRTGEKVRRQSGGPIFDEEVEVVTVLVSPGLVPTNSFPTPSRPYRKRPRRECH